MISLSVSDGLLACNAGKKLVEVCVLCFGRGNISLLPLSLDFSLFFSPFCLLSLATTNLCALASISINAEEREKTGKKG